MRLYYVFSNGSLPAGFIERINQRQPLSAPFDVKRCFVSLEEAIKKTAEWIEGEPYPVHFSNFDTNGEKAYEEFEFDNCFKADIINIISQYLPNFEHIETGKGLDGKM